MANIPPVIIIKKRSSHAAHHGGAWKVAYADFVTAMMALFIVLWLMSSTSKQTQDEISGYFRDPRAVAVKHGSSTSTIKDRGIALPAVKEDMTKLKAQLLRSIENVDSLSKLKRQIEITITEEGLRIELIESTKGTFFKLGSAQPTPILEELLKVLATQLSVLPNNISVEGHTDAAPYSAGKAYGNWELSTDRANEARRLMQANGVRQNQVSQVRGFADQRLRKPLQPFDASNRRISLIVQYLATKGNLDATMALAGAEGPAAPQGAGLSKPINSASSTMSLTPGRPAGPVQVVAKPAPGVGAGK